MQVPVYLEGIDLAGHAHGPRLYAIVFAERKGIEFAGGEAVDHRDFKEKEFDRLADMLRSSLDMDAVYDMLREARIKR